MKTEFISLTGESSHSIQIPEGQGSFAIGTNGVSGGKYDVMIEPNDTITWDCFNAYFTPYGAKNSKLYPYGDWPRSFYFSGNDTGFIEWSHKRHIEEFHWFVKEDVCIDLSNANIGRLFIHTDSYKVSIKNIGEKISNLFLCGYLESFHIQKCDNIPQLGLHPISTDNITPCNISHLEKLSNATSVEITNSVAGPAFDCANLLLFNDVRNLNLTGKLTNLEALSQLRFLETIGIRYSPDLTGFPHLKTWSNLKGFIGWNIEENVGKKLRAELAALTKEKDLQHSRISQLRKQVWFTTEYNLPFSTWNGKLEKTAIKAYKASLKEIKKAKTENEVHNSIISFVGIFNTLEPIDTSEREDIYDAVERLISASLLEIPVNVYQKWFDNIREF